MVPGAAFPSRHPETGSAEGDRVPGPAIGRRAAFMTCGINGSCFAATYPEQVLLRMHTSLMECMRNAGFKATSILDGIHIPRAYKYSVHVSLIQPPAFRQSEHQLYLLHAAPKEEDEHRNKSPASRDATAFLRPPPTDDECCPALNQARGSAVHPHLPQGPNSPP